MADGSTTLGIRELARRLDISIGTVSRALNDRHGVSAETRARVLEAAEAMGYSPNQSGRSLRQGATGMVAAMIPSKADTPLADTIFMTVLDGLRETLESRGLDLMVLLCGEEKGAFDYLRRAVARRIADGIIISDTLRDDPRIDFLLERDIPFVSFGRSRSGGRQPWIDLDFEGVAEATVAHLAGLGHRRMALATLDAELNYGFVIAAAFERALRRRGLPFEPAQILRLESGEVGGYTLGGALLAMSERPTAALLVDESMAIGLYRRLTEEGLKPGRELAIVGFLERPQCRFLSPTLACFRTPLRDLGARLGEALLDVLPGHGSGTGGEVVQTIWPIEYVPGESAMARHAKEN